MDAMRPLFESIQEPLLRDLFVELSEPALNAKLEQFLDRASFFFDPKLKLYESQTEEHDLEYTKFHHDYQDLLERVVDDFCDRKRTTPAALFALCEDAASGRDPVADAMLDLFVASCDYKRGARRRSLETRPTRPRRRRCFVSMCVERAKHNVAARPDVSPESKDELSLIHI